MLIVAYLGVVLTCAVGVHLYYSSRNTATQGQVRENAAAAQAAAEFAAEIAISNLTDMDFALDADGDIIGVRRDWVRRNPYDASGTPARASDGLERRISGVVNGYEYRVRVRDVGANKQLLEIGDPSAPSPAWLTAVNPPVYTYGDKPDPLGSFGASYEITANARNSVLSTAGGARSTRGVVNASEGTVRTIVNILYNTLNNQLEGLAVLTAHPQNLSNGLLATGSGSSGEDGDDEEEDEYPDFDYTTVVYPPGALNIAISGEDHYGLKSVAKKTMIEEIIEGLGKVGNNDSQLFSVTNGYWNGAMMTLQYMKGTIKNPLIPRTPWFQNNSGVNINQNTNRSLDRTMVAKYQPGDSDWRPEWEEERPADQYVFGGKQAYKTFELSSGNGFATRYEYGRSVTINEETGIINELDEVTASPAKQFASPLAVGRIENVLNLYLNYATLKTTYTSTGTRYTPEHPRATATGSVVQNWKRNTWRQLDLGYHSKNRSRSTQMGVNRRPLDNSATPARRRWAILIWPKNEIGQFLCREYSDPDYAEQRINNTSDGYAPKDNTWTGKYRWMYYLGYQTNSSDNAGTNHHLGQMHQNNTRRLSLHPRFLTLEELIGFRFHKDNDGIPAKVIGYTDTDSDKSRWNTNFPEYVPDSLIEGGTPNYYRIDNDKVVFDVNGSVFDELAQRNMSKGDNWGISVSNRNPANWREPGPGVPRDVFPPADGIYLLDDSTGTYKRCTSLRDFSFKKNIAAADEEEDEREMVNFHMVIEDTPEQSGNTANLYFDMGLTITLVYPKRVYSTEDDDFIRNALQQWWEGKHEDALTGKKSDFSVSVLPNTDIQIIVEEEEKLAEYFKRLNGWYLDGQGEKNTLDNIDTAVNDGHDLTTYNRAKFAPEDNFFYGWQGEEDDPDKKELWSKGECYAFPNNGADNMWYYAKNDLYRFFQLFPEEFTADNFFTEDELKDLKEDVDLYNTLLMDRRLEKAQRMMESIGRNGTKIFRRIEDRFRGYNSLVYKAELTETDPHPPLRIAEEGMSPRYVAGHAFGVQKSLAPVVYGKIDGGVISPLTMFDLNGSGDPSEVVFGRLPAGFLPGEIDIGLGNTADGIVPIAENVPMMAKDNGTVQPNGRPVWPKFVWEDGNRRDDPEEYVSEIHEVPEWYLDEAERLKDYSWKEHRGAIGWHRYGPVPDPALIEDEDLAEATLLYGDNYEFVIMTRRGFNPYITLDVDGKTYLVALTEDGSVDTDLNNYKPRLKAPADMPTFTIEGQEIDGAGILVVNGNLELKTRLAYHGLMIVTGNVYVEPTLYEFFDEDGNYLDKDGHVLQYNSNDAYYYYYDSGGAIVKSDHAREWQGELILQGKIIVGGTLTTSDTVVVNGEITRPAGRIDLRGSSQAIEDTLGLWLHVSPNEKFVADRMGWVSGSTTTGGSFNLWKDGQ